MKETTLAGNIFCLQDTTGPGPDVVLLHGTKFSARTWQNLGTLDVLAQTGCRVHALDMPGFGNSPKSQIQPSELLDSIIQDLNAPVLIGPSMGGALCLEYYFAHPSSVRALVLVGTVGVQNYKDRFPEIAVPTLLVWGGADRISPLANGHFLAQQIPNARLEVFENAAHPCYLDEPQRWHRVLTEFVESL
jgi:pimeloyl-ACP methyl ester carboxylesterase